MSWSPQTVSAVTTTALARVMLNSQLLRINRFQATGLQSSAPSRVGINRPRRCAANSEVAQTVTVKTLGWRYYSTEADVMGQLSVSTLFVLLCVGVTLSVAVVSDFDIVLQQLELLKLQILNLQSGKPARISSCLQWWALVN